MVVLMILVWVREISHCERRGWSWLPEKWCKQIQVFWELNHNLHFGPWLAKSSTKTPSLTTVHSTKINMNTLPKDLLIKIYTNFLSFRDAVSGAQVCRFWNATLQPLIVKKTVCVITSSRPRNDYHMRNFIYFHSNGQFFAGLDFLSFGTT
jgi:hypothetical protein